jgi:hypothetical protein
MTLTGGQITNLREKIAQKQAFKWDNLATVGEEAKG